MKRTWLKSRRRPTNVDVIRHGLTSSSSSLSRSCGTGPAIVTDDGRTPLLRWPPPNTGRWSLVLAAPNLPARTYGACHGQQFLN
ncbi:hypothetical protein Nepgr_000062 [Nepenthes gracilis]|uniref:Uncharacterized protein n=1 Tax=Nepenthes gracilis TaxID=150966 RepID=A0AAD3P4M0_NEPGR|nr:hypothetical protein Nepgr_000062 [Nepenthes gracilis]